MSLVIIYSSTLFIFENCKEKKKLNFSIFHNNSLYFTTFHILYNTNMCSIKMSFFPVMINISNKMVIKKILIKNFELQFLNQEMWPKIFQFQTSQAVFTLRTFFVTFIIVKVVLEANWPKSVLYTLS